MDKTVVLGVFSQRNDAEDAINELRENGYNPKDISIVMKDRSEGERLAGDTGADVAGGAVTGATTGAVLGGLAGLLASFVIPGLGAFFIGGPLATALGLTGAAASTVSGATTGAVAGGLIGALMGLGLPEEDARFYEERINEGGILVAIPAFAGRESEVEDILTENGADQVKTISQLTDRSEVMDEDVESSYDEPASDYGNGYARNSMQPSDTGVFTAGQKGGQAVTDNKTKMTRKGGTAKRTGMGAKRIKTRSTKGGTSTKRGRGWHGDAKEHSIAGQGRDVPGRGKGR
jgi:hypothetical protein